MGVYIKDMEMPKRCFECYLVCTGEDGLWCPVADKNLRKEHGIKWTRPDWCPLVPVPEHGRLIDVDALLKQNCMNLMFENPQERYESCDECLKDNGHCGLEMDAVNIVNAPTIIEAEEKNDGNNN